MNDFFDATTIPARVVSAGGIRHVNTLIEQLRRRRVETIQLSEPESGFRLSNMIRSFTQAHLRRCLLLIEAARDEFSMGRGLVALGCVRSIFESVAVYCDFERQLQALLVEGDISKIHEFVRSRAFATRKKGLIDLAGTEMVKATNILTQIDKMKTLRPSYRDDYDHLSELAHPNGLGALIYFQSLSNENDIAIYSDRGPAPDEDLRWVIVAASILQFLEEAIARIEFQLPALSAKGANLFHQAKPE